MPSLYDNNIHHCLKIIPLLLITLLLAGCASFGEGMMRGLMKHEEEDTRQCFVRGPAFEGLEEMVDKKSSARVESGSELKLLIVHGIGTHLPGYSTRLAENLAREMGLDVVDRAPKVITLRLNVSEKRLEAAVARGTMRGKVGDKNGTVVVSRYTNKDGSRSMTLYELSWSAITEADKRIIAYDNSGEYSFRRASVNRDLKEFINSHLPDPLIYLGNAHGNIQAAVSETLCWMFTRDYGQLPDRTDEACQFYQYPPDEVVKDSYTMITHSLGSRILSDAMQAVTASLAQREKEKNASPNVARWLEALRHKTITIFMLSNQLPLLQLGQAPPAVTNQFADYCTANGDKRSERIFARTNIIAFSDPNDILSWAVPPDYEDHYMDSRMCPVLDNVIINIAQAKKVLGIEMAPVKEAHTGYDNDARVIKLIARGMSNTDVDPLVKKRCEWMEVR